MLFSLIIPVYGVENFIEKCIESCCVNQGISFEEYELIIVNDSTPDKSIEIAQKVLARHPLVKYKIIERPNGGLSAARNTGIASATGTFLWFIDSDDYIEPLSLKTLKNVIDEHPDVEVISFGYKRIYPHKEKDCPAPSSLWNKRSRGIDFINASGFLSACARVYRREHTLDRRGLEAPTRDNPELRFEEGILWEDGEFNLRFLTLVDNHYCISDNLYNYVARQGSISNNEKNLRKTLDSDLKKYDLLDEWMQKRKTELDDEKVRILNNRNFSPLIFCLVGVPQLPKKERQHYYDEIRKRHSKMWKTIKKSNNIKNYIYGFLVDFFPRPFSHIISRKMQSIIAKENKEFNKA